MTDADMLRPAHATLRIAQLIFNTPLLCLPDAVETVASALAARWNVEPMTAVDASRFVGAPVRRTGTDGQERTLYRMEGGVALIDVRGELVNRGAWIGASSGLTSYEGLDAQLRAVRDDASVRGVVLDMETPGGAASGAMETATLVRQVAALKPVVAFVNGLAASAGYAIASGATRIIATPSATLGSIGVVWLHLDRSEQIAKMGLKPTLIHAGAHKVDGHSMAALPDDARARITAQITAVYDLFIATVASHRGMSAEAVRGTEAGVFMGQAAVTAGLADAVGTLDDAFAFITARSLAKSSAALRGPFLKGGLMSTQTETIADPGVPKAAHDAAVLAARTEGATAARARIAAIFALPEAKGRDALARSVAFDTELDLASATKLLAASPEAAAVAAAAPAAAGSLLSSLVPRPAVSADSPGAVQPRNETERGIAAFAAAFAKKAA